MRKAILLLMFLLLTNSVSGEDFQNIESLKVNVDIAGSIEIVPESSSYSIKRVNADLIFLPKDDFNQKVLSLDTEPEGEITDDGIKFEWNNPAEKRLDFGFNAQLRTYNRMIEVEDKVNFPIKELERDVEIYTKPSETIDSDDNSIIRLASNLVKGENDLSGAVFKLADWTKNNIQYNLSTLTEGVSQKASWVLENRKGVCDEITSLFIALCRAVGIPARFVSGIAYTDSELFEEHWGPHGWAEVYFPGYGFIAFDVTYGEFGFISAMHIKMMDSVDSASSSAQYEWIGRNVDLTTGSLEIKVEVTEKKGKVSGLIGLKANAVKKEAGFGSYNLIQANVKNLKDYYVAAELYLSKTEHIEILGGNMKSVLLKPKEEKEVFWIVKASESLDSNLIYTFPFIISSLRNATAAASFDSESRYIVFSLVEIEDILKNKEEEEEKEYSKEVNLNCSIDKKEFYVYESALIKCYLKNTGNVFLNELGVCFENKCGKFDLGIMQDKNLNFSLNYSKARKREIAVKARNKQVSKFDYISFDVLDEPKIRISSLEYPKNVSFEDEYEVVFVLDKESNSNPVDIEVAFEQNGFKKEWMMNELFKDRMYIMNLKGSNLGAGRNEFKIFVDYRDKNNIVYKNEEEFSIQLVNVTLWQRIRIFFNDVGRSMIGLSFRSLAITLFIAGLIFSFIVLYVFHKGRKKYKK